MLGVDWIRIVSPLIFDFNTLEVTFEKGGRRLTLIGCIEGGECRAILGSHLKKLFEQEEAAIAQLHSAYDVEVEEECKKDGKPRAEDHQWFKLEALIGSSSEVTLIDSLHSLLVEFEDLFIKPSSLPPNRFLEHTIHVKPNTEPVNVHSYRYSPFQKAEIEHLVKDMLSKNIIQPNQSPFASHILLVKKKDGSWRFCVDYR